MKSFDDQKTHEFLSAANLKTKNLKETKEFTKILQIILCQQDLIHIFYADKNNRMEDIIFKKEFHKLWIITFLWHSNLDLDWLTESLAQTELRSWVLWCLWNFHQSVENSSSTDLQKFRLAIDLNQIEYGRQAIIRSKELKSGFRSKFLRGDKRSF